LVEAVAVTRGDAPLELACLTGDGVEDALSVVELAQLGLDLPG
jgi:hypothetical protein